MTWLVALSLVASSVVFAPAQTSVAYAAGISYHVSTTGSDANAGTQAAPFKTIQKAASTAGAGDTVYIGPGTYNERVTVSKSGTSAAPIVFTAQSTRPKISRGIAISGSWVRFSEFTPWPMAASDTAGTFAVQISGDYNVVSGFDFPTGGLGGSAVGFKSGASYNTVSDFEVTDIPWCGAEFDPNSNNNLLGDGYIRGYGDNVCIGNHDGTANVIDSVEITGEGVAHAAGGWKSSSSDGDAVKIRGRNNVIRNSRIHHIFQANPNSHTDVFQIDAVVATGYVIDSCVIGSYASARADAPVPSNGDCPNQYLMLETGAGNSSVTVQNSTFLGDGGAYYVANLNPSGYSSGGYTVGLNLYNNTFYSAAIPVRCGVGVNPNAIVGTVKNNVFAGTKSSGSSQAAVGTGVMTWTNNLFTNAAYDVGSSVAIGDPKFVNPDIGATTGYGVNADWRLQPTSPAINAGVSDANTPATDAAGNARVGAPDLGAFEYGGAPAPADTTAPTVSLTSPTSGATLTGTASLAATAADNVGVARVEFRVDGTTVNSDYSAPYSYSWASTAIANGAHTIGAVAYDAAGNASSVSQVGVAVSNAAPPLPPAGSNVALAANGGQVLAASDQVANGPATAVNDGQIAFNADNTTWMVANPSGTEYVELKLAAAVPLSRIDHFNDGQYGARTVTVKTSIDGSTWQTAGTYPLSTTSGAPVRDSLSFTPVTAEYVRLEYTSFASSAWLQVNEVQVFAAVQPAQAEQSSSLTLDAPSAYPAYGAAVTLAGSLRSADGKPVPSGTPVSIEYSYDARSWRTLATATTWASNPGYFRYSHVPSRRTYYRARFVGNASYLPSSSASYRRTWPLAGLGRPTASTTRLRYGKVYTFKGALKPAHSGGRVVKIYAYRKQGGRYVYRKSFYGRAKGGTTFYASIKLPYKGRWRLRAYHAADDYRFRTYSGYRYITVK